MRVYKPLFIIFLASILSSCGDGLEEKKESISIQIDHNNKKIQSGDAINVSLSNPKKISIDSVQYFYHQQKIGSSAASETISANLEKPLGKNMIEAKIFTEGENFSIQQELVLHHNKAPKIYTYEVINTYPHDPDAFTQGLEFYKDTLYEGTGLNKLSSLRKVNYETGEVLQKVKLKDMYFGEGISILNDKIYQLTWRSGEGIIYDVNNLKQLKTFSYSESKEGWGLCNDGEKLYKSDGTEKIWILNPETLEEESYFQPVTHTSLSTKLNELEWVEGKIYANTWQKDGIAIINPKSGAIEGIIDMRGLRDQLNNTKDIAGQDNVLNGIAYNKNTKKLYVTGKNWDKLFEIKIKEK
ncbi:glutaminyl-peptide cyclotransferase [Mesonia sp. MT50]|uniref:Glutaminyl-peptide cyclotransferase n=1 Tax=Mesonia profundi TaxID=3070998 RepID=A0ABU1A0G3_9FLAO|nr:glutaminyl-peptide cyclotransferase [Mesonia profundi]MDQ7916389.1 glutaminyl-peptide cyclotransferase [Mesonia profundi]